MDFSVLEQMCKIHAPSGSEYKMTEFVLDYIQQNQANWNVQPTVLSNGDFQDSIILVFGKPKTAIFAHLDSIGFTVGYGSQLIRIGGPQAETGYKLVGEDSKGPIECELFKDEDGDISYTHHREIERGTTLTFKCDFRNENGFIESCYLDNRLGVFNALKIAENLKDGIICFSCYEEHGGGSAQFLGKYIYENYNINNALISDITWVTSGVQHGNGVAISMRDSGIPRRKFLNQIIKIAKDSEIPYQLEVESAGGSDGNVLHNSSYPFQWCFIGAAEDNVHSPYEKVAIQDFKTMLDLYNLLMLKLD
ncbi:MAG: putative aminopeptidase FrvX [Flavobacteriales bacterium]|jgi:putative aminopeptidase FrvX|tara:strand:+ start:250 stop:1170 length:921 start_codon:yes stop_codon:yes gene_type:complete